MNSLNWFSLSQGREVFALPGKVDSLNAFGTNGLIKQGAKLVSGVDDIIEELNLNIYSEPNKIEENKNRDKESPDLSIDECALYNSIAKEPVHLDELLEKTHLSSSRVIELLLRLQVKRLIKQLPGQQFARN